MAHLMGAAMELQKVTIVVARRRARLRVLPARGGPLPPHEGGARRPDDRRARRPRRRGGRLRPRHERRRQRSREGHGDRALDGLRVGHGRQRLVAHAPRRQLRALGGDEAAPRLRAGAPHRLRLRRGAPAAPEAPRARSTGSPLRCSRRRRSSATRSSSFSWTSRPSPAPPSPSACRGSSRPREPLAVQLRDVDGVLRRLASTRPRPIRRSATAPLDEPPASGAISTGYGFAGRRRRRVRCRRPRR